MGPAHWFGRGHYGWFGNDIPHRALHHRSSAGSRIHFAPLDLLQNPGNGEIMPTTSTYLIFWLPSGFHYGDANGDAAYESAMQTFFKDVGGTQILNTTTQYPGNNGTPSDTSNYVTSVVDTTAFPHAGTVADPVTQGDLNQEVFNQINANSWPTGMSTMYFVFLPDNVVDCDNTLASCNTNAYCAYHTRGWGSSDTPANDFIWADIPVNRGVFTTGGCGNSNVTGDNQADTTLSSVEHEMMEAITDPRGNAWQDSTGGAGENGDKCNRNMGVANSSSTTVNNFLGSGFGDLFRIQREWSNAAALAGPAQNGCAASYTTGGSHVEVPAPGAGDVTNTVTESTIQGNNGDLLHYHVSFKNPSNQDDAFSVAAAPNYPAGVSGSSSSLLGDLSPHASGSASYTGTVTGGPLLDRHRRADAHERAGDDDRRQHAADSRPAGCAESGLPRLADVRDLGHRSGLGRHGVAQRERPAGRSRLHGQRRPHGHRLRDDHGGARRLHRDVHGRRPSPSDAGDGHGADHRDEGGDDHDLHRADGRRAGLPGHAEGTTARGRLDAAGAERSDRDPRDRRSDLSRDGRRRG
jgi:hypothetical protein